MIRFDDIMIDRHRRAIERGGTAIFFDGYSPQPSAMFRLACILLLAGPKNKQELFDLLYADDETGGPLCAIKSIEVRICDLKKRFAAIGIDLHAINTAGRRYYFAGRAVVEIPFAEAAE